MGPLVKPSTHGTILGILDWQLTLTQIGVRH